MCASRKNGQLPAGQLLESLPLQQGSGSSHTLLAEESETQPNTAEKLPLPADVVEALSALSRRGHGGEPCLVTPAALVR